MKRAESHDAKRWWALQLILIAGYLALRLPNLRAMPVFTDEATYALWARIIAADPLHQLWVSMQDAKLPLHYWLLALARPLASDPITSGRLLSVLFGAASIPALMLLCRELSRLGADGKSRELLLGGVACGLMITCPLIAMQQRLALAEPLLLLESIALGWLSLRLGRLLSQQASQRQWIWNAVAWGLVWAATLLTKQNFSYLLWLLLPLGQVVWMRRDTWRKIAPRGMAASTGATLLALFLFIPALFTDTTHPLGVRLFYKPVFFPHDADISRGTIAWQNLMSLVSPQSGKHAQWWPYDPAHPLDGGWLYIYLTPPVFLLVGISLFWIARQRHWKILAFLGGWSLALLGALTATASLFFSRYTALGSLPLLLVLAWAAVDVFERLRERFPAKMYGTALGILTAALLAWPAWAVAWSAADWRAPTLVSSDVEQHLTRFSGGVATQEAVTWLQGEARRQPITVIAGSWIGLPNDMLWLNLQGDPNVSIYWTDISVPMMEVEGHKLIMGTKRWIDHGFQAVALEPQRPAYLLMPVLRDPKNKKMDMLVSIRNLPEGSQVVKVFANPPAQPDGMPIFELNLFQLKVPEQSDQRLSRR